ncbi:MAG: hypothetical protein ACJ77Z_09370 [Thermoleophilaceae bacterium]
MALVSVATTMSQVHDDDRVSLLASKLSLSWTCSPDLTAQNRTTERRAEMSDV